jgi:hypothetical protein
MMTDQTDTMATAAATPTPARPTVPAPVATPSAAPTQLGVPLAWSDPKATIIRDVFDLNNGTAFGVLSTPVYQAMIANPEILDRTGVTGKKAHYPPKETENGGVRFHAFPWILWRIDDSAGLAQGCIAFDAACVRQVKVL